MCQFKIQVERVCKIILKLFPNGLYGVKTADKQCSWPSRLPGISNYVELKGCVSHSSEKEN